MRSVHLLTLLTLAVPLAACGGGGGGGPLSTPGSASLSGAVTAIDGSSTSRGGVALTLVETGERVVTAPDGSFAFSQAPTGSVTLLVGNTPNTDATLGEQTYATSCALCHGADGSGPPNARNTTPAAYAAALARPPMSSITLTPMAYDAVYAFLSDAAPNPTPTPTPSPTPPPPSNDNDGAAQYKALCASCHGDFDTPANAAGGDRRVLGARACAIEGSLAGTSVFPGGVPAMAGLQGLNATQIEAIASYLNSQEVTGQQRYEANCAGCHGPTGEGGRTHEGVRGEDASETREAISEESAMRYLACLSNADLDSIADYLGTLDPSAGDDDDDDDDRGHDDGDDDGHHGGDGHHDADEHDVDDGDEVCDDEVEVHRVRNGERVHVRLRLRDGRVERADVSRSDHNEREAEVDMQRTAANDDADMTGQIEVETRDDRERFEIEVEHATSGRDLEAVVIAPDGSEASLGSRTVNAVGEAEWEIKTSSGGMLPFGVADVSGLEGYEVVVRDAAGGTDLLTGNVPDVPGGISQAKPGSSVATR